MRSGPAGERALRVNVSDELGGPGLTRRLDATPAATFEIGPRGGVLVWSAEAERLFGWAADELIGESAAARLIAPRHGELFESLLESSVAGRVPGDASNSIEVVGLHRDGTELTLRLTLVPRRSATATLVLEVSCRDVSERRQLERLLAAHDAVNAAIAASGPPELTIPRLLEQICSRLGWSAGILWRAAGSPGAMRCLGLWTSPALDASDFEELSRQAQYSRGEGLPGTSWARGEPVWAAGLRSPGDSEREAAAHRAGLQAGGGVPIRAGSEVLGVLEFFATAAGHPGAARLAQMETIGLQLGRFLEHRPAAPWLASYRVETRSTHLAFSCAFMKFLTVHGEFRDFGGWVEIEDDDPRTARCEIKINAASVDTRSLERDYHLRSNDFFAVEQYPELIFRSRLAEPLGDQHFRVLGDLTIRNVTRPIRLEARLEERETKSGVERVTLSASTIINRADWFLDWERALQAGRWIVGNEVRLDLVITLVRRT